MRDFSVLPSAFHHLVASDAEAFEMAVLPYRRQGGQQLDFAVVALQQHLGNACRAAKVTVDLERRMGAEEIGVGTCRMASVKMNGRFK